MILLIFIFLSLTVLPVYAEPMSGQELEDWFNDDSELDIDDVNEGQLTFIPQPVEKDVVSTDAFVKITGSSLDSGMVSLQQCYRNLDPVPEVDVVYRYNNMQQLRIISSGNIEDATVVGTRIQLKDVTAGAFVCIAAEVQLLEQVDEAAAEITYQLSFGPYYRRFLDGYYPYHATVTINYPDDMLDYASISPSPRPHFNLVKTTGKLKLDTWFEGVLLVDIRFKSTAAD